MSDRNTFVTSYIYGPDDIQQMQSILEAHADVLEFIGNKENAGFFAGRLDTIGGAPYDALRNILDEMDAAREHGIPYEIVVITDELRPQIITRRIIRLL